MRAVATKGTRKRSSVGRSNYIDSKGFGKDHKLTWSPMAEQIQCARGDVDEEAHRVRICEAWNL